MPGRKSGGKLSFCDLDKKCKAFVDGIGAGALVVGSNSGPRAERKCVDGFCGVGGVIVGVDLDAAEVVAEAGFHEKAGVGHKRVAGG